MSQPYAVIWDLDRTLGLFDSLEKNLGAREVTVYLRPEIEACIRELDRLGFKQTVLTLATQRYAEIALRGTGLRDYFVEVAGVGLRAKGDAAGLGELLGIDEAARRHRMIFVGDHPLFDAPQDRNVVFHLEPRALQRNAMQVLRLITTLREVGGGSLLNGYDCLVSKGESTAEGGATVDHRDLGKLLFVPREQQCPVVCFDGEGDEPGGTPVTFEPLRVTV